MQLSNTIKPKNNIAFDNLFNSANIKTVKKYNKYIFENIKLNNCIFLF